MSVLPVPDSPAVQAGWELRSQLVDVLHAYAWDLVQRHPNIVEEWDKEDWPLTTGEFMRDFLTSVGEDAAREADGCARYRALEGPDRPLVWAVAPGSRLVGAITPIVAGSPALKAVA